MLAKQMIFKKRGLDGTEFIVKIKPAVSEIKMNKNKTKKTNTNFII